MSAPNCTPLIPPVSRARISLVRSQLAPERVRPRVPSRIPLGWRPPQLPSELPSILVTSQVRRGPAGPWVDAILVTPEAWSHIHGPEILGSPQLPLPVFSVLQELPLAHMDLHLVRLLLLLLLLLLLRLLLLLLLLLLLRLLLLLLLLRRCRRVASRRHVAWARCGVARIHWSLRLRRPGRRPA